MRRKGTGMFRKQLAFLLTFALLAGLLLSQRTGAQEVTEVTDYGLRNPVLGSTVLEPRTWDCIYFGHYWQRDTNDDGIANREDAKEPILWRVLSVDGDDAFLLSERNLELKRYNELSSDQVTWETSTMRSWLNGYDGNANQCGIDYSDNNFLDDAFFPSEQDAIRETNVNNRDNWVYNTEGGNDTTDKVYLLSLIEAITEEYGFSTTIATFTGTRKAKDTDYVWETRRCFYEGTSSSNYKQDVWWLRSSGAETTGLDKDTYGDGPYPSNRAVVLRQASMPQDCGYINADGDYATSDGWCVRPVLHIDLSKESCWTYAGTVSSSGEENLLPAPVSSEVPIGSEQPAYTPDSNPPFSGTNDMPVPPVTGSDGITTWDCIYFGRYWQSDTNHDGTADRKDAKEKIKWRVLSVDGDDALLLADKIIAYQPYNETWVDITWAASTVRSWLNGYGADVNAYGKDYTHNNFMNYAFSASEQSAIRETALLNEDNEEDGIEGGEDTTDKVYLLSKGDMDNFSYGFWDDYDETKPGKPGKSRCAEMTEYVRARETFYDSGWWLRSPADKSTSACYVVSSWGYVAKEGGYVNSVRIAVRPALHLDLSRCSYWANAGQVTSDGRVIEPVTPTPSAAPTAEPLVSQEPTEAPGVTWFPAESEGPEMSAAPTAEPSVSQEPTETPDATWLPVVSGEPEVSAEPPVSQKPTETPGATWLPAESGSPEPSIAPTAEPLVSQKPTETPNATWLPAEGGKPVQPGGQTTAVTERTETEQLPLPGKVTGLKLKAKKRAIQVRWKKCSGAMGYEIWYSTSKNWKKKKVKVAKGTKQKLGKLRRKKAYYIRVRAFTIWNGKKKYGKWSRTVRKRCR